MFHVKPQTAVKYGSPFVIGARADPRFSTIYAVKDLAAERLGVMGVRFIDPDRRVVVKSRILLLTLG
jgi:hypothetical protein